MGDEDDVVPAIVICDACGSAYAARQMPNGDITVIGRDGCSCGADALTVIEETESEDTDFDFTPY